MKSRNFYLIYLLIAILLVRCKGESSDTPSPNNPDLIIGHADKKPIGNSIAQPVSKAITVAGGVISHAGVEVQVPEGAIKQTTNFSLQPIENTLNPKSGNQAVRILPENIDFEKPVLVQFDIPETQRFSISGKMIAYQDKNQIWNAVPTSIVGDKLQIQTKHFSDWVLLDRYTLFVEKTNVEKGEQIRLSLQEQVLAALVPSDGVSDLPLGSYDEIGLWTKDVKISQWKIVKGPGELIPKVNSAMLMGDAIYQAPAVINKPTEVNIQVEVESLSSEISDPKVPSKKRKIGKLFLYVQLWLIPDTYVRLNVGNQMIHFDPPHHIIIMQGKITIRAGNPKGENVSLVYHGTQAGSYDGGYEAGESIFIWMQPKTGPGLPYSMINGYTRCSNFEPLYAGQSQIKFDGQQGEGSFKGPVYYTEQACGFTAQKDVELSFRGITIR
ncbi:hypothetical protein ACFRAE_06670 [Sphingobacterium sp. HJSM2_6]|uniref:hypothetical protein n=1 Tax=Sphingobacterium sp. HJSM2_6 TaxID=3366264 RepID=UPI003BD9010C